MVHWDGEQVNYTGKTKITSFILYCGQYGSRLGSRRAKAELQKRKGGKPQSWKTQPAWNGIEKGITGRGGYISANIDDKLLQSPFLLARGCGLQNTGVGKSRSSVVCMEKYVTQE